jgi:hypothetical protein
LEGGVMFDATTFSADWHRRWNEPEPRLEPAAPAVAAKHAWQRYLGAAVSDLGAVRQDQAFSRRLAEAYTTMRSAPEALSVRRAYQAFILETLAQYRHLERYGVRVQVTRDDPYPTTAALVAEVRRGRLLVYATGEGEHPLMTAEENDLFRAVHDCFGHCATGRTFDRHGEEAAYRSHAEMYSPLARRALATETRGQNAALVWTGAFQAQKAGLLPAWAWS